MAVWDKKILWAVMFILTGALGQIVNYPDPVCGIKGSTVTLPCSFNTLKSVDVNGREVLIKINRVVWCKNHEICQGTTPSVYDSESNNNPRYRYLGDKKGDCTLQISDLQKEDDATFRFRVETNDPRATFTGRAGVRVTVVGGNPGGGGLPLIVGLVVGVLLVLFAVILVVCIIKRKRAAGRDQTAVGRDEEQKHSDNIYSNDFLPLAEQQGPSSAVEEVSYASVQFTHKKQARPAEEAEDSIIYSSVARTS